MINPHKRRTQSQGFRIIAGLVGLTVIGTLAATTIPSIRNGQASAGTQAQRVVRIDNVKPNAKRPPVLSGASTGSSPSTSERTGARSSARTTR